MNPGDDDRLEGPAYPAGLRALATALVLAVVVSGWRAREAAAALPPALQLLAAAAALLVLTGWIGILMGRTRIDGRRIVQQGIWRHEVALADITQLRLIDAPRLRWIVASRLVVRARGGWPQTFSSGDPAVQAGWRRLAWGEPLPREFSTPR